MPGKICPKCQKATFFETPTGRKCTNPQCTFEMIIPANDGKGGKGTRCARCGRNTVFNNVCRNPACGARYK